MKAPRCNSVWLKSASRPNECIEVSESSIDSCGASSMPKGMPGKTVPSGKMVPSPSDNSAGNSAGKTSGRFPRPYEYWPRGMVPPCMTAEMTPTDGHDVTAERT